MDIHKLPKWIQDLWKTNASAARESEKQLNRIKELEGCLTFTRGRLIKKGFQTKEIDNLFKPDKSKEHFYCLDELVENAKECYNPEDNLKCKTQCRECKIYESLKSTK